MGSTGTIPAPPKGFSLDEEASGVPAPPSGFQLDSPKQYLPEVNQAVATVPKPSIPSESATESWRVSRANPKLLGAEAGIGAPGEAVASLAERAATDAQDVVAAGKGLVTTQPNRDLPAPALARSGQVPYGEETPESRAHAETLAKGVQGGMELAAPLLAPAVAAEPLAAAGSVAAGYLASKGTKEIAKVAGASPEMQDLAEQMGWLVTPAGILDAKTGVEVDPESVKAAFTAFGGRAGVGVHVTPEEIRIRGGVGPLRGEKVIPRSGAPAGPALEPPTIQGGPLSVENPTGGPGAPPTTPAAPPMHEITMEEINEIGDHVAQMPIEKRAQATLDVHTRLADELLKQGRLVTPDHKIVTISNQKQAESLAQKLINEEISRQDKKAHQEVADVPAPPAGFTPDEKAGKVTAGGEVPQQTFAKEDRVTLPNGDTGTINYLTSSLARVNLDKGGKVSINPSKLKAVQVAAGTGEVPAVKGPEGVPAPKAQETQSEAIPEPPKGFTVNEPSEVENAPQAKPGAQPEGKESVIYARHGATALDQAGGNETVAGWSNEPLDGRGKASAEKIASDLKDSGITHIVSSDLPRAKQTADIVGEKLGVPIQPDERLRPQHIPETEGKKVSDIQHVRDHYKENPDEVPRDGESLNQFKARQEQALSEVHEGGEKPLVVTHSTNLEHHLGKKLEPGEVSHEGKGAEVARAAKPEPEKAGTTLAENHPVGVSTGENSGNRRGVPERRSEKQPVATERREGERRVSEMTRSELQKVALEDYKSGGAFLNERAWKEREPEPHMAITDVDGLGAVNDKFGHEVGDGLIKAYGEAFRRAGIKAYRIGGDEVMTQGETPEKLRELLDQARGHLKAAEIDFKKDGEPHILSGVDFSYGIGPDEKAADGALYEHKRTREATGDRAQKGHLGRNVVVARRDQDLGRASAVPAREQPREEVSKSPAPEVTKESQHGTSRSATDHQDSQLARGGGGRQSIAAAPVGDSSGISGGDVATGRGALLAKKEELTARELEQYQTFHRTAKGSPVPMADTSTELARVREQLGDRKQPWQRTKVEVARIGEVTPEVHKRLVAQAIERGKPVPAEVLKDYPELAKPSPAAEVEKPTKSSPESDSLLSGESGSFEPGKLGEAVGKLWKAYVDPPTWDDYEAMTRAWTGAMQASNIELQKFSKWIKEQVPDKLKREAISNYIEAGGDANILRERAEQSKDPYKAGYEAALKLTKDEQEVAQEIEAHNDLMLWNAQEAGMLTDGLDNYVQHVWDKDSDGARKIIGELSYRSLQTNPSFTRERVIPSYFEGEQIGLKPQDKDVGFLTAVHDQSFNQAVANRGYIKSLMTGKAGDGRPLAVISRASAKQVEGNANDQEDAYLIKPNLRPPQEYADYRVVDHPALRGWRWSDNLQGEGSKKPVIVQGDMLVHPEVYQRVKNNLSKSALQTWTARIGNHEIHPGRAALKVSAELKNWILSYSGFHQTTLGIHAMEHRVSPFNVPEINLDNKDERFLLDHGLMVGGYSAMEEFAEGVAGGGLATKIPIAGPIYDAYRNYLFKSYLPRIKMAMAKATLERNQERYGKELSEDQIGKLSADQANAAFGQLNLKALGRNQTFQDVLRLALLAPDFLEARARFVGQAGKPWGREQFIALALGAAVLYTVARLLNQMLDKDPHYDKPFSVVYKGKEYQFRTVQGDLIHAAQDPRSFIYSRINPIGRMGIQAVTGTDDQGRKRDLPATIEDFVRENVPIPAQSWARKNSQPVTTSEKVLDTLLRTVGVSEKKYHTPVEEEAARISRESMPPSAHTPKEEAKYQLHKTILDDLRSGERKSLNDAIKDHKLTHQEAQHLEHRAHLNPLEDKVTRFSIEEVKHLLGIAKTSGNHDEEEILEKVLRQKRVRARYSWERINEAQETVLP